MANFWLILIPTFYFIPLFFSKNFGYYGIYPIALCLFFLFKRIKISVSLEVYSVIALLVALLLVSELHYGTGGFLFVFIWIVCAVLLSTLEVSSSKKFLLLQVNLIYLIIFLGISLFRYSFGYEGTENPKGLYGGWQEYFGFSYGPSTRNNESTFYAMLIFLGAYYYELRSKKKSSIILIISLAPIIYWTYSRSCILSVLLALFYTEIILKLKKYKNGPIGVFLYALMIVFVVLLTYLFYNLNLQTSIASSNFERVQLINLFKIYLNTGFIFFDDLGIARIYKSNFYVWLDSFYLDGFVIFGPLFVLFIYYFLSLFIRRIFELNKKLQRLCLRVLIFYIIFLFFNSEYLLSPIYYFLSLTIFLSNEPTLHKCSNTNLKST